MSESTTIGGPDEPCEAGSLRGIFQRYRGPILRTYGLFVLENCVRLVQPLAIGLAVADLLDGSTRGLWLLLAQCVMQMAISTARHLYDTRTFGTVAADLAGDMVLQQRSDNVSTSLVAARSSLSRHFSAFFEHELPVMIATGFSLLGAIAMLAWFDWVWGVVCAGLLILNGGFARVLARRSGTLNARIHDLEEQEVNVVERHKHREVRAHFATLRALRVRLSDWHGFSHGVTDFCLVLFLLVVLLRWEAMTAMAAGDLVALIRYAIVFVTSLTNVPLLVQQLVRLRDIGRRLRRQKDGLQKLAARAVTSCGFAGTGH